MNSISRMPPGPSLTLSAMIAAPALLANLAMHVAQAFIRVIVQIFSVDEGGDQLLQLAGARRRSMRVP